MARLNDEWVVLKHGAVEEVADGILTVQGSIAMPLGKFPRRMTAVRLEGGGCAIWSAMPLREEGMGRIETLGRPRFLVVPNPYHRLDIRAWKRRYPDAVVVAPSGAREAVAKAIPIEADERTLQAPEARLVPVDGTGGRELAFEVRRADGLTLIVNDVIAHVAHPDGLGAWLMARVMGFGVKAPATPRIVKRALVRDQRALARQFRNWAADPRLRRIIPSHGEIVAHPAPALEAMAAKLGG